jgi:S-adenosylmethionine hydrolase
VTTARPVITFLSDFGPSATGVCRGVMFGIAPDANIIDINHQVPRFSIRDGAASLVFALPHMPVGIHVAIVDPGVGTDRLPIAIRVARGDVLIGPDNGLLIPATERLGGIAEVRALENRELMLPVVSASFHGRDIFAPMAAHLAMGVPLASVGRSLSPERLVRLAEPRPSVVAGRLETQIVDVMIYGNATLAGRPADLEAAVGELSAGRRLRIEFPAVDGRSAVVEETTWGVTFASVPVGSSVLMADSEGNLSLADNQGDAARRIGLEVGQPAIVSAR